MSDCNPRQILHCINMRCLKKTLNKEHEGKGKDRPPYCFEATTVSSLIQEVSTKLENKKTKPQVNSELLLNKVSLRIHFYTL